MDINSKAWERVFQTEGKVFTDPHQNMPEVITQLQSIAAHRILDLGCGTGRHIVNLAQNGFSIFGLDNSRQGLSTTKTWLNEVNLSAELVNQEMTDPFPWEENFFDGVISVQVIHHADITTIKKIILEIKRVLRKGGLLFITVPKLKNQATKYEEIEPNTFVPLDGWEKGLPHHYFTPQELKSFFTGFDIRDIHLDDIQHYCMTAFKQ